MDDTTEPKLLKGGCPHCHGDLKRIYSKKKDRHYWFCQSAEEICGKIFPDDDGKPRVVTVDREPVPDVLCPECGAIMEVVEGAKFGPFMSCSSKDCKATIDLADQSADPSPENLAPRCPDDPEHGHMKRRSGKNGTFWGCRCYPTCTATRQIPANTRSESDDRDSD